MGYAGWASTRDRRIRRDGATSGTKAVVAILTLGLLLAASGIADGAPAAKTTLVSKGFDGSAANDASFLPSVSAGGRYISFTSVASNLVPDDANGKLDVFLSDRQTGTISRVSVSSSGSQANGPSSISSISADGRYVAYNSDATNLVRGDTNETKDIFVYHRRTGTTTRVSVRSSGRQANRRSGWPAISADGRYVAFTSLANNLVRGDTNHASDVFVYDRRTGTISRVSVPSRGGQANGYSGVPSISADGRYVAYDSDASNLVRGDTNDKVDAFVHDRQTGRTTRVSVRSNGDQATGKALSASISANGRYVAFYSKSANLVRNDTNQKFDVFVHDRRTGRTQRVSVSTNERQASRRSRDPSISGDGRYVAFFSLDPNLVPGDTNRGWDVFVRDRQIGTTRCVSVSSNGDPVNGVSQWPSISANGKYVAFDSYASNLVADDTNDFDDLFVRGPLH